MTEAVDQTDDSNVATEPKRKGPLRLEGFVDTLTRQGASGWAWLPEAPQAVVEVEAFRHGRMIGRTRAEQPRPDLLKYGKGTGLYGFTLKFDHQLDGDEPPQFRGIGLGETHDLKGVTELPPAPVVVPPAPVVVRSPPLTPIPEVEGHVDNLTRWGATGWAWAPKAPDQAVLVEAVLGDRVIGRVRAAEPRPDLAKYGKGTGQYGFMMKFDEALDEELPEFRALVNAVNPLQVANELPPQDAKSKLPKSRGTISRLLQDHSHFTSRGPEFEEFDASLLDQDRSHSGGQEPLLMAFYLPQFHPIAENDKFWGKGFTEWRQMPRGLPRYPGHYQPRIPRDLGFYDLMESDALKRQVTLGRSAGINAFAYYYYWFNTKRVLERPLDALLASDVDMPFLLIWANENWTRTWDGADTSVLLRQDYKEEDEEALVNNLARYFNDRRYVRLQGRPLFIIYNPSHIPEPKVTIARWRRLLSSRHGVDPLIFMAQTFGAQDPEPFGLDGAMEFPPHKLSDNLPGRPTPDAYSSDFTGRVIDYDEFCEASLNEAEKPFPLIKTVVPSWDNDSRRPNRGLSLENTSPKKYQQWLQTLLERAIAKPVFGRPIVAVNAWNEWAEGAYLEPDVHYGAANLNATARALTQATRVARPPVAAVRREQVQSLAVSVILPNFNHERFLRERIGSVLAQTHKPDEIVFLDDCSSDGSVALAESILRESDIPYRIVLNEENSGCVFRQWVKGLELARNDLIWIAETDDSAHPEFLAKLAPYLARRDVAGAFGHIRCVDDSGAILSDLDNYFDNLLNFSWDRACVVPAYQAFRRDFVVRNVVPNASGFVFRKPHLTALEYERLQQYRFAGDWYFYALLLRGGCLAYEPEANSYFRLSRSGTSRSAFFTDRHLEEHRMVLEDLSSEYRVGDAAVRAHVDTLLAHFPDRQGGDLLARLAPARDAEPPLRVCIAAHSFEVGGGEILPLELANALKQLGLHVTYLIVEDELADSRKSVRRRLRSDIPIVFWPDVSDDFGGFLSSFGIQVFNSHNVSVEFSLYCKHVEVQIPYVGSLHGGYETVPDLMTEHFSDYLRRTVDTWLYLAKKNTVLLGKAGIPEDRFARSFNAVPAIRSGLIDRAEFRHEYDIPENGFVTFLCSRAIPEKGWRVAIEALQLVRALGNQPVWLVLIGDGPSAAELRQAYGSLDWVIFLGHVDSPSRYFGCFDLGVFPSTFSGETFPLFLVECFQAGKPVVATDIGEIPTILGDDAGKRAGILVPHEASRIDLVYAVAEAVAGLLKDPTRYERMRTNAIEASSRFSMLRLAETYKSLFTTLVNRTEQEAGQLSLKAS
ncbi:glycoside hydrolase family 99-like domain-containing protein [Bradyrhizobium prioriisuperbiae]|uniref:glycoside hydrolase family 99-like domain-containing protein n=1 Tax=Bradyrhizobium prioriisuperbiae TaxID=2854389 RepID=UPI0028E78D59|nr:glycoside hydrolase family 99-like domain-containing protein [Bradyrhizobium prioritasuperba]